MNAIRTSAVGTTNILLDEEILTDGSKVFNVILMDGIEGVKVKFPMSDRLAAQNLFDRLTGTGPESPVDIQVLNLYKSLVK